MESHSRIFKVIVQFQEKDEVFYSRIKSVNGVPGSLVGIICARYPSLSNLIKRCFVIGESNFTTTRFYFFFLKDKGNQDPEQSFRGWSNMSVFSIIA